MIGIRRMRDCRRFGPTLLSRLALSPVGAALCRDGLRSSPRISTPAQIAGAAAQPIATQGRSYRDRIKAESLAKAYVKVAIHCFNQPYAACEYQRHDSRPAHRPTVVPPFASEGPAPCRGKSAGPHHPRLLGPVALPSRTPTGFPTLAFVTKPGHRLAV